MHTDATLQVLSQVTASLGDSLRDFEEKTCNAFETRELERERAARRRRQEKQAAKQSQVDTSTGSTGVTKVLAPSSTRSNAARLPKRLNLKTYTYHSLGDYVSTIRQFGTTDSYTTQRVSYQLLKPVPFPIADYQLDLGRA